jgi:predicted glycogen debranching enzyme
MILPTIELSRGEIDRFDNAVAREWLVTKGLGGFAAGTVAGACTRRYHGLLVASLRPPVERTVMVAKLETFAHYDGRSFALTSNEFDGGTIDPQGFVYLESFELEGSVPVWRYVLGDARLEQRITMVHGENTTVVSFTLVGASAPLEIEIRPLCTYRDYHSHTRGEGWRLGYTARASSCEIEAFAGARPYRLVVDHGRFEDAAAWYWNFRHRVETCRGLDDREDLFCPGRFVVELRPGETGTLIATAESETSAGPALWATERRRQEQLLVGLANHQPDWLRHLVLAADQFVVERAGAGTDGTTIIAGYPWFSDWGRDTMIALPGLTLATGRYKLAANILRTFGRYVSEGMLPNRFPDSGETPEFNTVDATLWYFNAIDEYLSRSGDFELINELYPVLLEIIEWHLKGTRYAIHADSDGLLHAGEPGVQLTWMDAKIGDWVVTPRIGKPVEINALWYRALVVMQSLAAQVGDRTAERRFATLAGRALKSFRHRYWLPDKGYLADVIDGPDDLFDGRGNGVDTSLRPNQIFAVSVDESLLEPSQARAVVDVCARKLWTPLGLRSLAPSEPAYLGRYRGGPVERDAAYHQGTVWSWLLGPFALAHFRVYEDAAAARAFLQGIGGHLRHACIGTVSEIFDANPPHSPEGCFAQAWSVAEVLRAWMEIDRLAVNDRRFNGEQAS